jgi:hypothetical protein
MNTVHIAVAIVHDVCLVSITCVKSANFLMPVSEMCMFVVSTQSERFSAQVSEVWFLIHKEAPYVEKNDRSCCSVMFCVNS